MGFWLRHFAVLILILIIVSSILNANLDVEDEGVTQDLSDSGDRFLVFVSNLDGSVSALDGRTGEVKWSMSVGVRPLLLSSISDIQMNRNGQPSSLIPSLDGSLYQMDGEVIEPIPLAADLLLTSTYKLTDEASIVGGKEIETYGIDVITGKLRYVCSSENCRQATDLREGQSNESNEVLVVKRTDRTIRLVDVMEGHEKWNFSVGQLDLSYHIRSAPSVISGLIQEAEQEEGEPFQGSKNPRFNFLKRNIGFKVKMPIRTVTAVDRDDPSDILWEHQFDTSIAGVWMMKGHELHPISLFDEQNFSDSDEHVGQGMMYIGEYNDMWYIQPSDAFFENRVAQDDEDDIGARPDDGKQVQVYMPRVRWKPYIATARSRTPIIINQTPHNSGLKGDPANSFPNAFLKDKSLALLSENQYPFDSGYFLYRVHTPIEEYGSCQNTTKIRKRAEFITALSGKWKEVSLFLFIGVASLFSFLKKKFNGSSQTTEPSSPSARTPELTSKSCSAQHDLLTPESGFRRDSSKEEMLDTSQQFVSRYLTDFRQQECLGKGGFGVVFKAFNRIDECSYAVKRIELKDSKTALDKVMREVKALAKLDHPGIVRYHQSWLECPPLGWQERNDSFTCPSESIETSMTSNLTSEGQRSSEIPKLSIHKEMPTESSGGIIFTNETRVDVYATSEDTSDNKRGEDSVAITMEDSSWDGDSGRNTNEMVGDQENGFDSESIVFEGSESFCMIESPNHDSLRRRNIASSQGSSIEFLVNSEHSGKETPDDPKDLKSTPKRGSRVGCNSKKLENNLNQEEGSLAVPGESPRKLYLYIQMQLCKPESLREWLNTQPFEREATYDIFYQIVSAISYVHAQGLMHRDLKPSNILFAMDGSIKIGDFGLVTDVESMCDNNNSPVKTFSVKVPNGKRHTNQVGTQLYMSPELSSGQNYTHKVDIYALGVIFFEMFQRFSTQMERVTSLKQLRELKFPGSFLETFRDEHEFVEPLLSHDPSARPEACDLLGHKLLANYEESNLFRRLHRTRTLSMHSNSSSSQGISTL